MTLHHVARKILSITAIAWGIPFMQAEDIQDRRASAYGNPKLAQLDVNRDGKPDPSGVSGVTKVKDGMDGR